MMQKWHPDKHKSDTVATSKFQEINEAYNGILLCIYDCFVSLDHLLNR